MSAFTSAIANMVLTSQSGGLERATLLYKESFKIFMMDDDMIGGFRASQNHPTGFPDSQMWAGMLVTDGSLKHMMPTQSTSFAQQFSTIISSGGWPAHLLLRILRDPMCPPGIVDRTGKDYVTGLHWAARYFGQWLMMRGPFDKATSYKTVAVELIKRGADVHAVHSSQLDDWLTPRQGIDPFLSFLQGANRVYLIDEDCLSTTVQSWGETLSEAGCCLLTYARTASEFLQTVTLPFRGRRNEHFTPVQLFLADNSTLAVRVLWLSKMVVSKARSVSLPGAWPTSLDVPDTITWTPAARNELPAHRWVTIDTYWIRSRPYLIHPLAAVEDDMGRVFFDSQQDLLAGTQDDHSRVATILACESNSGQREASMRSRRRTAFACSVVPIRRNRRFSDDRMWVRMWVYPRSSTSIMVHKCPFDSRWRLCSWAEDDNERLRECMQGRCSTWQDLVYPWEIEFSRDMDRIAIAKKHAKRLRPELSVLVEITSERVDQREKTELT